VPKRHGVLFRVPPSAVVILARTDGGLRRPPESRLCRDLAAGREFGSHSASQPPLAGFVANQEPPQGSVGDRTLQLNLGIWGLVGVLPLVKCFA
jgi:hypothetical protein